VTKNGGPSAPGDHGDQAGDQNGDHVTTWSLGHGGVAEALLIAIAEGSDRSVELAGRLAEAVLGEPLVKRAIEVREMLRTASPFALVRALELAEQVVDAHTSAISTGDGRERRGSLSTRFGADKVG
jgi:hypothetical protein